MLFTFLSSSAFCYCVNYGDCPETQKLILSIGVAGCPIALREATFRSVPGPPATRSLLVVKKQEQLGRPFPLRCPHDMRHDRFYPISIFDIICNSHLSVVTLIALHNICAVLNELLQLCRLRKRMLMSQNWSCGVNAD